MVPAAGRARVIEELHIGHPGISRRKSLARNFVWWPGMDSDLEGMVKECHQVNQKAPPNAPLHPWIWPNQPWSRLHIDHAEAFMGKFFFMVVMVVDAHSKWFNKLTHALHSILQFTV